jgi:hypothetical protein
MRTFTLKLATLFLLVFTGTVTYGQIEGTLTDDQGEALAFANVLLLEATDSSLVKGAVVNEAGSYQFVQIPAGSYLLEYNMIGYLTQYSDLIELGSNESVTIDPVALAENIAQLQEVEVVARKPIFEQQIDRLVINVESSITLGGGTALDVLERSPGVMVNRQNRTISLAGKEGVVVMINDKMTRMDMTAVVQMLGGMSADNIEKVELITIPPANFDAEGNAGIINIVLKENNNAGLNGSFAAFAGYGLGEKYGGSLNFNYRRNRVNLFGSYSYSLDHNPQLFTNYRSIIQNGLQLETETESDRDPYQTDHNARLGLDIELTDKTVLGILVTGYDSKWDMTALNNINISEDGTLVQQIEIPNDEINQWRNAGGNINLQHKFSENEQLTFDVDYLFFHDNNPTNYVNNFFDGVGNFDFVNETRVGKRTPISIYVGKVDYRRTLNEKFTLETGLKGTLSRFENDVSVEYRQGGDWEFDPELTQKYNLAEDIAAAYVSLSAQLSEKTSAKFGLRYEYTDSNLNSEEQPNIVDRQYGNFFPTLFISHNLNEDNTIQLAYNRRIQRPTFNDLAPFVIFLDPNTFFSGNPALQPGISDGVRLEYRRKSIVASLNYSYDDEAIANFQPFIDPETNIQTTASANMDFRQSVSLNFSIPAYIGDWWVIQTNLGANWQQNNLRYGDGGEISLEAYTFQANMSHSFELPNNWGIELTGFYLSPAIWGLGTTRPFGAVNFGLQKELNNNAGTLRFSVSDIFFTANWRTVVVVPEENLNLERFFRFSERVFRISYSRNFGNNELRAARNRATGSEEERNRVN